MKNAIIAVIGISLLLGAIFLVGCDDSPPTGLDLPPVMTCVISGEVNLNYSSKKGAIHQSSGFPEIQQFYFSSYSNRDGIKYDLLISIFYEPGIDSSGEYKIYSPQDTTVKNKYAWAAFVVDGKVADRTEYWADSGLVRLDSLVVSSNINFMKGAFSFKASDTTGEKFISADSGFFNIKKYY